MVVLSLSNHARSLNTQRISLSARTSRHSWYTLSGYRSSFGIKGRPMDIPSLDWQTIHSDILGEIFLFLGPWDCGGRAALVCRRWRQISDKSSLWELFTSTMYPHGAAGAQSGNAHGARLDWKSLYRTLYAILYRQSSIGATYTIPAAIFSALSHCLPSDSSKLSPPLTFVQSWSIFRRPPSRRCSKSVAH